MQAILGTRDFNLVKSPIKGNRLPKRAGAVSIIVNGTPFQAPVSTNRAWSADAAHVLEYIWLDIDGTAYYLTLNYAEKAIDLAGSEFEVKEGVAKRKDPVRVTAAIERESTRVSKFKAWAAARV